MRVTVAFFSTQRRLRKQCTNASLDDMLSIYSWHHQHDCFFFFGRSLMTAVTHYSCRCVYLQSRIGLVIRLESVWGYAADTMFSAWCLKTRRKHKKLCRCEGACDIKKKETACQKTNSSTSYILCDQWYNKNNKRWTMEECGYMALRLWALWICGKGRCDFMVG